MTCIYGNYHFFLFHIKNGFIFRRNMLDEKGQGLDDHINLMLLVKLHQTKIKREKKKCKFVPLNITIYKQSKNNTKS